MNEPKPKWYYLVEGESKGPVHAKELMELAKRGVIKRETLVRAETRANWTPAKLIPGLISDSQPNIYLLDRQKQQFGPVSRETLNRWYSEGKIDGNSKIRFGEHGEWEKSTKVFPQLNESQIDIQKVANETGRVFRSLSGTIGEIAANWNVEQTSYLHLRKCINNHFQYSFHSNCATCQSDTVGIAVHEVIDGTDDLKVRIHSRSASRKGKIFAPFVKREIQKMISKFEPRIPYPINSAIVKKVYDKFIFAFLRRNERPVNTATLDQSYSFRILKSLDRAVDIVIEPKEIEFLEKLLMRNNTVLWTNRLDALQVFNAFALYNDFNLLKKQIEQLESQGMPTLRAYSTLVNEHEIFMPFLLQLLANRRIFEDAETILFELGRVAEEMEYQGFEHDLIQRRTDSFDVTMDSIDLMNPFKFELLLGMFYEAFGYSVIETPKSGDQGADVLVEKAGAKTVIQAKLYSESVGNKAVQEAIAARTYFRCHHAAVVTNRHFTRSAKELAASSDVQLVGRKDLSEMVFKFNSLAKDYGRLRSLFCD